MLIYSNTYNFLSTNILTYLIKKIDITYSQLFGEEDPDQDVSPDTADPEAAGGTTH